MTLSLTAESVHMPHWKHQLNKWRTSDLLLPENDYISASCQGKATAFTGSEKRSTLQNNREPQK